MKYTHEDGTLFTKEEFLARFQGAYGEAAADEIKPHLNVRLVD